MQSNARRFMSDWVSRGAPGLLSVVIPAHNEEGHIEETVRALSRTLAQAEIAHEILVVNDNSQDATASILARLAAELPGVRYLNNAPPKGFGYAIRLGLEHFQGEVVAVYMADGSDTPQDVVRFYRKFQEGYDCVFGSRFTRGGKTIDYPWAKLVLNRLGNTMIRLLFLSSYNDFSNAFKMYGRNVIAGVQPILAYHFNITVELPLKAVVRGYSYAVVPNTWINRTKGLSKFRIKEMGSRYLFIILYCFIEKLFSQKDYYRNKQS